MEKIAYEVLEKIEREGFHAYLVGGYPRDYYLGRSSTDYDICTNATPDQLKNIFSKVLEENYGSSKIIYQEKKLEITTFRIDENYVSTRTPIVRYTSSLEEDLRRRDFVINTLCMDKEGNYIDYMGAIKDIDNKIIRSVGNPFQKMKEDPLRILRAIRFATILGFKIDKKLEEAIIETAYLVTNLSYQRKREELDKILISSNCLLGVQLLKKYGLDDILECSISELILVDNIEAMWAQINFSEKYPFTRTERKKIETIRFLVNRKKIEDMDLYRYGLQLCIYSSKILKENIDEIILRYQLLPIHSQKEINITMENIKRITSSHPSSIFLMLEEKIINRKIKNNQKDIEKFLQSYFIK